MPWRTLTFQKKSFLIDDRLTRDQVTRADTAVYSAVHVDTASALPGSRLRVSLATGEPGTFSYLT